MRRYFIYAIAFLSFIIYSCDNSEISSGQADEFTKIYGSEQFDELNDVFVAVEGYYLVGSIGTSDNKNQVAMVSVDLFGNSTGSTLIEGGEYNDEGKCIVPTDDGGFLILGNYQDVSHTDIILYKINRTGEVIWEKRIGGTENELISACLKINDGFLLLGSCSKENSLTNNPAGTNDIYLVNINEAGDILWENSYGGSSEDIGKDIVEHNGGFTIVANSTSFASPGQTNTNILIIETDHSGNRTDMAVIGGVNNDYAEALTRNAESIYILGGSENQGTGSSDLSLISFDMENREIVWEYNENSAYGYDLYLNDTEIVAVGSDGSSACLLKIDFSGSEIEKKLFGGIGEQVTKAVKPVFDRGYVLAGNSGFEENQEMCLIKIED